ncbi:MAG: S1/P1 nuclease, partial [Tepidisphaeraceae bacterium]
DEVRDERQETSPWHYVNIPYSADGFDRVRDGNHGDNVADRLEYFANLLNDRTAPPEERIEALKFLVHFAGDIHQPLHCADRNNDRGGNGRLVFFLDKKQAVNLHKVWDTEILEESMRKTKMTVYAGKLAARITPKQASQWCDGTPQEWAEQGHRLAVTCAYAGVPVDGPPPKLKRDYVTRNVVIVDEQLSKAGVRLAWILNRIFE